MRRDGTVTNFTVQSTAAYTAPDSLYQPGLPAYYAPWVQARSAGHSWPRGARLAQTLLTSSSAISHITEICRPTSPHCRCTLS